MKNNMLKNYTTMSDSVKASIWFMICSVFQKGISLITVPIFTRLMTAQEYGQYSVFLSWENVLVIFATLNLSYQVFNNGMVKFSKDQDGYTTAMVGLTSCSILVTWTLYCLFEGIFFHYTAIPKPYMVAMFLNMFFTAVIGLWTVRQRYEFKYKALTVATVVNAVLNPILGLIFVGIFEDKVGARIISITITNFLIFIVLVVAILRKSKKILFFDYWKYALKLDLPLIPHYLSMVLLNNSDRIMIDRFCGSTFTAFYSVAYNVSMVMQIIVTSINSSFNPWLYHKLKEKKYSEIRRKTKYLLLLVAVTSMLPALVAPEILSVMGTREYRTAANIVPVLSGCVFLTYIYTLFSNVELFYEKPKYITAGSICATMANLVLNYIFIQKFGYMAAAYTTLACYVLLALFHYMMMSKTCIEQGVDEKIYDLRFVILLSAGVFLVSFAMIAIYKYVLVRYILLSFVGVSIIVKRKILFDVLSKIKD